MLPKIDVPIYELTLPLTKKSIRFRPFLVKEEKILLMAMESNEADSVLLAIKQILTNCCLDDLDVDDLPITDIEYLFLNLRARSVNEVVELPYRCNNKIDVNGEQKECGNIVTLEMNLLEIHPEIHEKKIDKIELSENMGILIKYPSFKMVEEAQKQEGSEVDKLMNILVACIDGVYTEETIFYSKDVSKKELLEFVENLTREQFSKIQEFFETMPKIKKDVDFKCAKCGYHEIITIEGLQNFFV
jgi:DNA-directed RNA polymerase subunit M/transcription elongation factor TFIIS